MVLMAARKKDFCDEMSDEEGKAFFKKMARGKGLGIIGGFVAGVVVVILGIFAIFFFAIIGALMGAITGWILEQTPVLGAAIKDGFAMVFGVVAPDLVAIGAMLGFIAGFFKHSDCSKHCD